MFTIKFRRISARLLLPFFLVWSVTVPRPAQAVLPLAIPLVASLVNAAGAVVASDIAASAATALLGGAALALILSTPGDTSNVNGQVRIPLTASSPDAAIPAPAAPASASLLITYSFTMATGCNAGASGSGYSTQQAAFAAYVQTVNIPACGYPGTTYIVCPTNPLQMSYNGGASCYAPNPNPVQSANGCPAGYVVTGMPATCVLDNARAAAPDNKQDFQRAGAVISPFTGDDKPSGFDGLVSTTSTSNDTVTVSGVDGSGNPVRYFVQALSTGGAVVKASVQKTDANGSTYTHHQIVAVGVAGQVDSTSANDTAQVFSYNSATRQYDLTGAETSVAPPVSTTVNFPSDYARSGEAANAAQSIISANAADAAQVPLAASNATLDAAMAAHALVPSEIAAVQTGPDLVAAPSLFQPFTPAECSPLSFNFGSPNTGGTYAISLDVCTHVATIRNIFSWVLYLLTAALLFQMFTRRPDGAEG